MRRFKPIERQGLRKLDLLDAAPDLRTLSTLSGNRLEKFPEIEAWLNKGEEIVVHKRRKMIARLLPIRPKSAAYPDFSALRRQIFGAKKVRKTGTDLASEERGRY